MKKLFLKEITRIKNYVVGKFHLLTLEISCEKLDKFLLEKDEQKILKTNETKPAKKHMNLPRTNPFLKKEVERIK